VVSPSMQTHQGVLVSLAEPLPAPETDPQISHSLMTGPLLIRTAPFRFPLRSPLSSFDDLLLALQGAGHGVVRIEGTSRAATRTIPG